MNTEKPLSESLGIILAWLAWLFIGPAVFKMCWEYVMVGVFQFPFLDYWHSFALVVLLGFFKSRK